MFEMPPPKYDNVRVYDVYESCQASREPILICGERSNRIRLIGLFSGRNLIRRKLLLGTREILTAQPVSREEGFAITLVPWALAFHRPGKGIVTPLSGNAIKSS